MSCSDTAEQDYEAFRGNYQEEKQMDGRPMPGWGVEFGADSGSPRRAQGHCLWPVGLQMLPESRGLKDKMRDEKAVTLTKKNEKKNAKDVE